MKNRTPLQKNLEDKLFVVSRKHDSSSWLVKHITAGDAVEGSETMKTWIKAVEYYRSLPAHRNLMSIQNLYVGNPQNCLLVSELLSGVDLFSAIRSGLIKTLPDRIYILKQILRALGTLHVSGLIHRDVKLENIVFRRLNPHTSNQHATRTAQQQQQQQQIVEEVPIKDNTSVLNASLKTPLLPLQPQVSILRQELLQQYHNTLNNTDFDNNDYTGEVSNPLSDNNNINNKNFSPATLNSSSPLNWLPVLPRTPSNQQVIPQQQHSFASRSQLYFSSNSHQPQALFGIDNPPVHSLPNQRMSRSMFNITAANNNSFIHQNNNKSRSNSNNPLNNNNNSNKNSLESSSHRVVAPLPPFRFSPQENTAATFGLRRCNSGGHSVFGSLTARRIAAAGVLESKGVDENLMKTSVLFSRLMSSSAAGSRRGSWKDQAAASNLYFNTRNVQSSPFSVLELNNNNAVESSFVYQQQNGGELLESVHEE
eukprot:GDKJ01021512.1.p1 GENE.GDKJ01021512.1~~GDKJ01021512.1.p1  ORF type:complete len:534 (-),score=135.14 GDKJ01021512.1:171-1613(-)